MSHPFANFDLELFLENFPDVVRQPMPLAIGASLLAHTLFFLGLPVVTGASNKVERPDRIVNVIELSPAEQAKLPQTSAVGQVPLPLSTSGNFPPLSSLTPNATPALPPLNPTDVFSGITTPNPVFSGSSSGIGNSIFNSGGSRPIFTYVPPETSKSEDKPKETKDKDQKPEETKDKDQKPEETKDETQQQQTPVDKPDGSTAMPPSVAPGQQANLPTNPQPPAGAENLQGTNPAATQPTQPTQPPLTEAQLAQLAEQRRLAEERQKLLIATTYNVANTTDAEKDKNVSQQFFSIVNVLKQNGGDELVSKAIASYQAPSKETLGNQAVPNGWNLNFNGQPPQESVQTIVQIYLNDGGIPIAAPAVVRSSGFKGLDQQAIDAVMAELKAKPRAGKYQAIEFIVPFNLKPQPVG